MLKATAVLTILIMISSLCRAQEHGAVLRLERDVIDFGAVEYNSVVTDSVKVCNDGDEPLVIKSVFTDCGCTVPSYSRNPIAPGECGIIAVRFISRGRSPGSFRKAVRIRSNAIHHNKIMFVAGRIKNPATNK